MPKPTILGILIVNNFLTKGVQTKNQIVSKCANENLSICAILNIKSEFRISVISNLPNLIVYGILIVNNFLTEGVQTKNQIVLKYANENLSIKTNLIQFAQSWGAIVKLAPPQNCFINKFLIKDLETKIQNVHTCADDEQSNKL